MESGVKPVIYQLFPRLFTNACTQCTPNGTISQNGVGKMNQITPTVLKSIKALGVTHVWYTGVIEHATKTTYEGISPDCPCVVKGNAGSPYAIKDYYDIDPDIAEDVPNRIAEFDALVARTHKQKLKVIIDFVPNHVARQYHSDAKPAGVEDLGENDNDTVFFEPNNNFYYITGEAFAPYDVALSDGTHSYNEFPAKATGNDCFSPCPNMNDWYETVKLNYGFNPHDWSRHFSPIPSTWTKMLDILIYWAKKGVDGFRCDMAFMVPVEFWHYAIPKVKEVNPDLIFIAELYDINLYREYIFNGGFDYLYDKVNLYDTLRGVTCGYLPASNISHCWRTVEGLDAHMLNFLENHDEQRIASPQFAGNAQVAIPAMVISATLSKSAVMIYSGQELGEEASSAEGFSGLDGRTTIFDYWNIPSVQRFYNEGACDGALSSPEELALRAQYQKILSICNKEKAIQQGRFFDLMYVNSHLNSHRHYAYLREYDGELILVVANFNDCDETLHINIPQHAFDFLGIKEGASYTATELLSSARRRLKLSPNEAFQTPVAAHNAVVWRLKLTK